MILVTNPYKLVLLKTLKINYKKNVSFYIVGLYIGDGHVKWYVQPLPVCVCLGYDTPDT